MDRQGRLQPREEPWGGLVSEGITEALPSLDAPCSHSARRNPCSHQLEPRLDAFCEAWSNTIPTDKLASHLKSGLSPKPRSGGKV